MEYESKKKWRDNNKEYIKEYNKKYYQDHVNKPRAKKSRAKKPRAKKIYTDQYIRERKRTNNRRWYRRNKEKVAEYKKQYLQNHMDENRIRGRKYKALKAGAEGSHTIKDLQYIYYHQSHKCPCCGKQVSFEEMTVDHIIPLSWGGNNYPTNIQLLCGSCNSAKGNRNDNDYRDYIPLFLEQN